MLEAQNLNLDVRTVLVMVLIIEALKSSTESSSTNFLLWLFKFFLLIPGLSKQLGIHGRALVIHIIAFS